ncbi:hypothetical protein [Yersinia phage MHG19]|nr:hypothetical protein [Yersinia phage MHG19]
MIIKAKFKRLKINAGFTEVLNGALCVKTSEKEFHHGGAQRKFPADSAKLVWVDSFQVKKWYQW